MQRCLDLAACGAGHVSPNPMVGALLVAPDGLVLGEGWHQAYGGPHAEQYAVAEAEGRHGADALRQATLYVNLEPCNHHGKTPPCTNLILEKGIPRVVVGTMDPFLRGAGGGLARLRDRGVSVTVDVLGATCRRFNEAFLHHVATHRPLVTLKSAQTLCAHVATTTGDARWISGEAARHLTHQWRAELDGILVGSNTARKDDPALTVRHVEGRQPVRLVLDRTGRLPSHLAVFTDAFRRRTTAVVGEAADPAYADALLAGGGRLLRVPEADGHLDLDALLKQLGADGGRDALPMLSLLVEAGPGLATALLRQDLVDRFFLFVAPMLLGEGVPAVAGLGIERLADAFTFKETAWEQVGTDLLFRGYRRIP